MVPVGKAADVGGGGKMDVRLILQGSDSGGPAVWIGFRSAVRSDHKDGGEHQCGVTTSYNREAGNMSIQKVMGDTGGHGGDTDRGDEVRGHLHRPQKGDGSTVGGPMTTPGGLRMGKGLLGGSQEDMAMVDTGDYSRGS